SYFRGPVAGATQPAPGGDPRVRAKATNLEELLFRCYDSYLHFVESIEGAMDFIGRNQHQASRGRSCRRKPRKHAGSSLPTGSGSRTHRMRVARIRSMSRLFRPAGNGKSPEMVESNRDGEATAKSFSSIPPIATR